MIKRLSKVSLITTCALILFSAFMANAQGNYRGYKAVSYNGTATSSSFQGASDVEFDIQSIGSTGNVVGTLTLSGKAARVWNVSGKIDAKGTIRLSGQNDFRFDFVGSRTGEQISGSFTITAKNGKVSGTMRVSSSSSSGSSNSGNGNSGSYSTDFDTSAEFEPCESGEYRGGGVTIRVSDYRTVENSEITIDLTHKYGGSGTFNGTWQGKPNMLLTGYLGGRATSIKAIFAGKKVSGRYSIAHMNGPTVGNFVATCVGGGSSSSKSSGNSSSDDDEPVSSSGDSDDDDSSSSSSSSGSSASSSGGNNSYSTDFDTSADFEPCESGEYRSSSPAVTIRVSDYRTVENSEITIDLNHKYGGNGVFWGTWTAKPRMKLTGKLDGRPTSIDATFAGKKVSGRYSIAHMNGPTVGNFVATCVQ